MTGCLRSSPFTCQAARRCTLRQRGAVDVPPCPSYSHARGGGVLGAASRGTSLAFTRMPVVGMRRLSLTTTPSVNAMANDRERNTNTSASAFTGGFQRSDADSIASSSTGPSQSGAPESEPPGDSVTDLVMDRTMRHNHEKRDPSKVYCKRTTKADTLDSMLDMSVLDSAAMEDRHAMDYPLHTMRHIPATVIRSLKAHNSIFMFSPQQDDLVLQRHITGMEEMFASQILGKALYFRIVNLEQLRGTPASSGVPMSTPSDESATRDVQKTAFDRLLVLLRDYAVNFILPFPQEVVCDVSHFADNTPLVEASKRHVEQLRKDVEDLLNNRPVDPNGCAGPPPAEELEPRSAEHIAAEIASRIRKEVLVNGFPVDGLVEASDTRSPAHGPLRVCIGIAGTPVLAKIACDAEVAYLMKHNLGESTLVRIRSFHQHIRTVKDGMDFMKHFRLSHVPTFTPAFARMLQEVFGIETCGEIYEKRERLHFTLPKESFELCYATTYGRMRFPEEKKIVLFSPVNLKGKNSTLRAMALNDISVVNPSRTGLRGKVVTLRSADMKGKGLGFLESEHVYGRLVTDAQFLDVVRSVCDKCFILLHKRCLMAGAVKLNLRRNKAKVMSLIEHFPEPTNDYEQIIAVTMRLGEAMKDFRQGKGVEMTGELFTVQLMLNSLVLTPMVPVRMEAEITALQADYMEIKKNVWRLLSRRSKGLRGSSRKKADVPQREATTVHKVTAMPESQHVLANAVSTISEGYQCVQPFCKDSGAHNVVNTSDTPLAGDNEDAITII